MQLPEDLKRTHFERGLVRLLPPGIPWRASGQGFSGRPVPGADVRLSIPDTIGQGVIQYLDLCPDLHGLAIECQSLDQEFRFTCRVAADLTFLGYSRQHRSRIRVGRTLLPDADADGWLLSVSQGQVIEWIIPPGQSMREIILFPSAELLRKSLPGLQTQEPQRSGATGAGNAGQWISFEQPRIALLVDRLLEAVMIPGLESQALGMLAFAWMTAALPGDSGSGDGESGAPECVPAGELRKIQQARSILFAEFLDPPTTIVLARRVALNEFKLKRGYRQVYGASIHADLRRYRMHLARDLLIAGESNVAAAACAVGYSNPGHFARAFRREFGVAPGELSRGNRLALAEIAPGSSSRFNCPFDRSVGENYTQSQ